MITFVLVHSPLLGPGSWRPVAAELALLGVPTIVPDLEGSHVDQEPYWRRHAESVAKAIDFHVESGTTILFGHSGAGPLLPAISNLMKDRPAGYIFVDAGLPDPLRPRKGDGEFAKHLDDLHKRGRRYPDWTDEDLRDPVPDPSKRRMLLDEVRPQPPGFWDEVIPVPSDWPDAACGYLRFSPNPAYDGAVEDAMRRGWPVRDLPGGHFHLIVEPRVVAKSLVALARTLGV